MRAIWNGSLSFGLVNIPIRLYNGAQEQQVKFKLLHKKDHSPVRYARICRAEGKEISYQDIVKGYEFEKDEYIVLTESDFEKADMRSTHLIEIIEFTDEKEIDIRFFEKPYYLEPQKGADKAYALLREALKKSKKVAVAKFVLHNREHLGIIKGIGSALVLMLIRYVNEIREVKSLQLPDAVSIKSNELDLALTLIKQLTRKFSPKQFHDTYVEELEKLIDAKLKGKKPKAKGKIPKSTKVIDLMATLKASLKEQKRETKPRRKKASSSRKKAA